MGIYDREYVRVGPHSKSGLGSLGFISFNSWIIVINIAVFLLDAALPFAVPTPLQVQVRAGTDTRYMAREPVIRDAAGRPVPAEALGPRARSVPIGLHRQLIDTRTGEVVGLETLVAMSPLQAYGHFSTALGFFGLQLWRFITFQFLHANLMHLVFNMFGLWIFGGMVEQYLGSKRYAAFYLICGIFGAVAYLLLNFLGNVIQAPLPALLPDSPYTPLIGASAGVFGVIMASAYIAPNAMVVLLFPPIPLKLKWLAYGYVALAAWNLVMGGRNAGGDAAHLGGAIAGAFFIRQAHLLRDFFEVFGPRRGAGGGPRARPARGVPEAEVDRILAKVAQQGLRSLTDQEKSTLRRASEQARNR